MIILIGIMFLAGIALAVYGLFSSGRTNVPAKSKEKEIVEAKEQEIYSKEQKILKLQKETDSLKTESEKLKTDYTNLQGELETTKKKELQLTEDLARREDWVNKNEENLKKTKERCAELQKQFFDKERELQDEFTKNVNLNRELRETKERIQLLEKENKDKADQIQTLKYRIEGYIKEVKTHVDTISELKNKDQINEWVPKVEFNKLNEEYTELEKKLEEKDERIKKLTEEIIRMNNRLKSLEGEPGQQPEQGASEKEKQPSQEPPASEQTKNGDNSSI